MRIKLTFVIWMLAIICAHAQVYVGQNMTLGEMLPASGVTPIQVSAYISMAPVAVNTVVTPAVLQTGSDVPGLGSTFSANATGGVFTVTADAAPAFQTPIRWNNTTFLGTEAHVIGLTNTISFATILFPFLASPAVTNFQLGGFFKVPALTTAAVTYDLIVTGMGQAATPFNTEDFTLQITGGSPNYMNFEIADVASGVVKYGQTLLLTNVWLYYAASFNLISTTETCVIYDTRTWTPYMTTSHAISTPNCNVQFWEFGNNEDGYQAGTEFLFSGFNWSNNLAPLNPPYTAATNLLIANYQFNNSLNDRSDNGFNPSGTYGTSYNFVTGENATVNGAISFNSFQVTTTATNPVTAMTVSFWSNGSASGMPIASKEFTSWYVYSSGGEYQMNLTTTGGTASFSSTAAFTTGWHLFTTTWDGGGDGYVRIYCDGVLNATASSAIFGTIEPNTGGSITYGSGNTSYAWSGIMDDLRIYGRALNATEIGAVYAAGADANIGL